MHLLDSYCSTARLRYTSPKLVTSFYPLPFSEPYIVFSPKSQMLGKDYVYFEEVFDLIKQHTPEYKIIQTGGPNDNPQFRGVDLNLCGKTNFYELCYLVQNASLVLSVDTACVHISDSFLTPLVGLYGLTSPKISGGFFNKKNNQIYLEPDRTKFPPTFNPNDSSVNNIKPEEVARAILKQLNKDENLVTTRTLFFGENYLTKILELIPDTQLHQDQFKGNLINVRYDYGGEEQGIYANLQNYRCAIVTNRPLNIDILKQLKHNIYKIVYIIDKDHSLEFVKNLRRAGLPYELMSYEDQEWINSLKFDYCDWGIIFKKTIGPAPEWLAENKEELKFKSNRFVLSKTGVYPSIYHWKNNLPFTIDNNFSTVPADFHIDWSRDLCYYWVYKE